MPEQAITTSPFGQAPVKPFTSAPSTPLTVNPPATPQAPAQSQPTAQAPVLQGTGLDPGAVALAQAIRQTESNGNFQAQGKSGEFGAYQWEPQSWATMSSAAGVNVPLQQATPAQQNQVAYNQIKAWKDQGYNVGQIASMWNAGEGKPNAYIDGNEGVNAEGVSYDTATYAKNVATAYQQFKTQQPTQQPQTPATGTNNPITGDASSPSVGGFLGNVVSSGANFAGNLVNAVAHPLTTGQNLLETGAGALQEAGGQNNDNTAKFDQLKNYFVQRYGGVSNLEHTLYSDPIGFAADLSTVLGTGGGAVGLAGKAAEIGGLADTVYVVGTASDALGTAAKYTNPLTPAVSGAGALLNKTTNFSDVIANPENYTKENIANSSAEKITNDVQAAFAAKRTDLSETGAAYAPFKETPTPITTEPDAIDNMFRDSLKVNITDGVIKPTSTSLLRDQTSINKLQAVYNTYKTDFLNGSMDSEKLLNLRTDLSKIAFNDLGVKDSDVASMAAKVRGVVNDTYRPQVPGLSELDADYSAKTNKINELEDSLVYKTGANKGQLKTSFINAASKAVKNEDTDKLAQLEEIVPGITKRLQVMKTIKDLGDPDLPVSLLEKGGLAGGFITGNIKTTALAATAMILSKPSIAIPLMRALGDNLDLIKQVMANLAKSLTAGASLNNVEQSMPQSQEENLAKSPTQIQNPPTEMQNENSNPVPLSSDLSTLASNKGFDLQAARSAGYSDADILSFLQSQN